MSVSLPDYRAPGATDDRAALAAALATGEPVYLPSGEGSAGDGAYLIDTAPSDENLVDGACIFGDGIGKSVIRHIDSSARGHILVADSGSSDTANNLKDIVLRDLTLEDTSTAGFFEGARMIAVSGVTNALIERVAFKGFRGDAIYLGSSLFNGVERHNRWVTIRDCLFDGINQNNRNAISVIDGDGVTIENCQFVNCTRPGDGTGNTPHATDPNIGLGMPGPIDVEPNAGHAFAIVRNIKVVRCRFRNCGGNAVALLLPSNKDDDPNDPNDVTLTVPAEHFLIEGCLVEDCSGAFSFFGYGGNGAATGTRQYDVRYERTLIRNVKRPFVITGAFGVEFVHNQLVECNECLIGYTATNRQLRIAHNAFTRCGKTGNALIQDSSSLDVAIEDNHFLDCGKTDNTLGRIFYIRAGDADYLRFNRNRIDSPSGRTTHVARKVGGHTGTINTTTCQKTGNVVTFTPVEADNFLP